MKSENNQFLNENFNDKYYLNRKVSYISRNDSTDETNFTITEINEVKFDFQIPEFFNDQTKIYYNFRRINPLIPEGYTNLNKECVDLSNENFDDELIFS
jgi:hypothetical protein